MTLFLNGWFAIFVIQEIIHSEDQILNNWQLLNEPLHENENDADNINFWQEPVDLMDLDLDYDYNRWIFDQNINTNKQAYYI